MELRLIAMTFNNILMQNYLEVERVRNLHIDEPWYPFDILRVDKVYSTVLVFIHNVHFCSIYLHNFRENRNISETNIVNEIEL